MFDETYVPEGGTDVVFNPTTDEEFEQMVAEWELLDAELN